MIDDRIMAQRKLNATAQAIETPQMFLEHFPDMKREKADKLFEKYLSVVRNALLPRLPFLTDGQTYISTHSLVNECGEFQYKNKRYWVWKEFKDLYPLVNVTERGSNLKKTSNPVEKNTRIEIVNERFLNMLLEEQSPKAVFGELYKEADMAHPDLSGVPIDMDNLRRFIGCTEYELETAENSNHREKLFRNLWQARIILKVGQHTLSEYGAAELPLIPAPSDYGRMYYKGMNIQNVTKEVRSAVIGRHYQYDMNAASFAIKLHLYGILNGGDNNLVGTRLGTYTREYLQHKNRFRERLARECFEGINLSSQGALKAVKNALTAIGFGAKTTGRTWLADGERQGTALSEIITAHSALTKFLNDPWVVSFLAEQKVIEAAILEWVEGLDDYEAMCQTIRDNGNGRVSASPKLAYIYQHYEKHIMDLAVDALADHGIEVICRIHDAFIVRDKVPARALDDISAAWGLRDYLTMDCDEVREWIEADYKRARARADQEEADHRERMVKADQLGRIYQMKKAAL